MTVSDNSLFDEKLFQLLKDKKVFFDLYVRLDRKVANARVVNFSVQDRLLELNKLRVNFWDINRLEFTGVNAIKFFKEILPELPVSVSKKNFDGRTICIYPFGEKGYQKWTLLKEYPYFFVLHSSKKISEGKGKKEKPKVFHTYIVKYKLFISAHSLFSPYPGQLIYEKGELYDVVKAGAWRKGAKDIASMLNEELVEADEKLLTFALKDGREITGVFEKNRSYMPFCYRLFDPDNRKRGITIYKHAIDDFWEVT
jgi:hypothetical protein